MAKNEREDQIKSETMFRKLTELHREKFEEAETSLREELLSVERAVPLFFRSLSLTIIVIHFPHFRKKTKL